MSQVGHQYTLNKNRIQEAFEGRGVSAYHEQTEGSQQLRSRNMTQRCLAEFLTHCRSTKEFFLAEEQRPCPEVYANLIPGGSPGPKNNMGLQRVSRCTLRRDPHGISLKVISSFALHLPLLPFSREHVQDSPAQESHLRLCFQGIQRNTPTKCQTQSQALGTQW